MVGRGWAWALVGEWAGLAGVVRSRWRVAVWAVAGFREGWGQVGGALGLVVPVGLAGSLGVPLIFSGGP
jgi:hypothetical protein